MANPQPDKHTRFSNELLEEYIKITRYLSPYENAVWLCIFRKTYGFQKKEDWVSLSQIEDMTGIRQPHVVRTKKKLIEKNMIVNFSKQVGIQKNYDLWNIPKQVCFNKNCIPKQVSTMDEDIPKQVIPKQVYIPKQDLPKQVTKLTQTGNQNLPKQVDTKETITKDNTTKDNTTAQRYFYEKFKETFGKSYIANFGKDGKIFHDLLNIIDTNELKTLIDKYFHITDKFLVENGYSIGLFKSRINSLRIEAGNTIISEKGLKSVEALKSWAGKSDAKENLNVE